MTEPLSLTDIEEMIPGTRVMKYSDLSKYKHLPKLPMVILYETEPNYGHWVAILETPEGVEHFDSYGIIPDNELKWIPRELKKSTGQDLKRLLRMLYDYSIITGQKINYNNHRLQGSLASTCGRWCVLRILFYALGTDRFYRMVKSVSDQLKMSPDSMVSLAIR